jgi:hypothetical protein
MTENNLNRTESHSPEGIDVEQRRELLRKMGKFALYAAPFTVLALKGNASAGGHGSGGLTPSSSKPR